MEKNFIQFSYPISSSIHKKMKTLASARGKSLKGLFFELLDDYFRQPDNKRILDSLQ